MLSPVHPKVLHARCMHSLSMVWLSSPRFTWQLPTKVSPSRSGSECVRSSAVRHRVTQLTHAVSGLLLLRRSWSPVSGLLLASLGPLLRYPLESVSGLLLTSGIVVFTHAFSVFRETPALRYKRGVFLVPYAPSSFGQDLVVHIAPACTACHHLAGSACTGCHG